MHSQKVHPFCRRISFVLKKQNISMYSLQFCHVRSAWNLIYCPRRSASQPICTFLLYSKYCIYLYIYIVFAERYFGVQYMYSTFSEHKLPSLFTPVFSFRVKYQYIISSLFIPMCTCMVLQR